MPVPVIEPKAVETPQGILVSGGDLMLVAAAKEGDSQAFGILVQRYRRRILSSVLRLTRNHEDAEDVVQQAFQKAFSNLNSFEGRSSFCTWLTRIALNEALMMLRSDKRSRELSIDDSTAATKAEFVPKTPDASLNPEHTYSLRERRRLLSLAMRQLKPEIREAVELCGLQELPIKRTAQIMGLSVSAAKSRVLRGRRRLRETLSRYADFGHSSRRRSFAR